MPTNLRLRRARVRPVRRASRACGPAFESVTLTSSSAEDGRDHSGRQSEQVFRVRPDGHPMHVEPATDGDHALAVRAGSSDSVHLALRQGCSSSSPRVRDDSRLVPGVATWLLAPAGFRLIPRGAEPLDPLPGVRLESTRVHPLINVPTPDTQRLGGCFDSDFIVETLGVPGYARGCASRAAGRTARGMRRPVVEAYRGR